MSTKLKIRPLSEEEIAAGATMRMIPESERLIEDNTEAHVERSARAFILGTQKLGHRREIRTEMEDRVVKRIGKKGKYLVDKLFELIDGVEMVQSYTEEGKKGSKMRYYKTPPNLAAITYALDRVLGKPTQHTEVSEEKKGIMIVEHIIRNLAEGKKVESKAIEDVKRSEGQSNGGQLTDGDAELRRIIRDAEGATGATVNIPVAGNDIRAGKEPL